MTVAVTGARGLIGSRIVELLQDSFNFLPISSQDLDIRDENSIENFLNNKEISYLLHLAAKADVDGCEAEKDLGEESEAWKINVKGSFNIANYCKKRNIKLIYISTDFVFDGEKEIGDFYTEEDTPNPINFYAKTKYEGEKAVISSGVEHVILRIAYPYREKFEQKKDFVRAILERLKEGLEVNAVTDHIMCPTFIDDIAYAIKAVVENNPSGIYHAVGSLPISPYDAAIKIAENFSLNKELIKPTTREKYFEGKAPRPFNLSLKNDKIKNLGVKMRTFEEGIKSLI